MNALARLWTTLRLRKRSDLINFLIRRHAYRRYLEIGVNDGRNFARIVAPEKESVDPRPRGPVTHLMTSDELFARLEATPGAPRYDIVFVDGLHEAAAAERDILNALRFLSPAGTIVVHDCNPATEELQAETRSSPTASWSGTVWKAWVRLRSTRPDLAMSVVDMDRGCGVIRAGSQVCFEPPATDSTKITYELLERRRHEALNLVSKARFVGSEPGPHRPPRK